MHRIDTATAQKDKFGAGKNGFTNGDSSTGRRATQLDADVFDAYQEEICAVIEAAGVALDKGNHAQLLAALKALFLKADDSRVSNALQRGKNLGDLESAAKAKSNLGLDKVGNWMAVQANGGHHSTGNHHIYIDWGDDSKLHVTVDASDVGEIFTTTNPPTAAQTGAYPRTGGALADYANVTVISGAQNGNTGDFLYSPAFMATLKGRGGWGYFPDGATAFMRIVEHVGTLGYIELGFSGFGTACSFLFDQGGNTHAQGKVYCGSDTSFVAEDGNIYGPVWGGYLNNWVSGQIGTADNNNRNWTYQNFVNGMRLGAQRVQVSVNDQGGAIQLTGGEMLTGAQGVGGSDFNKAYWRVRGLQYLINGQWVQAGSL